MAFNLLNFREVRSQDQIWQTFLAIMAEKQAALTKDVFDSVKRWYGINIPSFTIFLFWIDSTNFLPLDANTTAFIESNRKMEYPILSYEGYKSLLTQQDTALYRRIAKYAWIASAAGAREIVEDEAIRNYFELKGDETILLAPSGCQIIAIKPLAGCNPDFLKVLKQGQLYLLNEAYSFGDDSVISYNPEKDTGIYKINDLTIDINAIVGKNGTGKSSLMELFLAAINNIAYEKYKAKQFISDGEFKPEPIDNVKVELYIRTLTVYRFILDGKKITVKEYKQNDSVYEYADEKSILEFPLSSLFYSIIINYSQYAFNASHSRPWLRGLFYKNDAYQLPIVLDPFRIDGNIDINIQTDLAKSRLLANLLERQEDNDPDSDPRMNFRKLTDFQLAVTLKLSLLEEKVKYVYVNKRSKKTLGEIEGHRFVLGKVIKIFGLPKDLMKHIGRSTMEGQVLVYIFRKLLNIARTYPRYKKYYKRIGLREPNEYLAKLKDDHSHIAYKLRQAINYLKYGHLSKEPDFPVDIEELSLRIDKIKEGDRSLQTIELIPPSFFDIDIVLFPAEKKDAPVKKEDQTFFNGLSSGEKQQIFSINAIVYHLRNIHSVYSSQDDSLIKYPYICVVLDEIELYFHPELQRNFVHRLLKAIETIDLANIRGINFFFITHSPFILSDIPRTTSLFLEIDRNTGKAVPLKDKPYTFGANIHELLSSGFFMKDTIGEFARRKIAELLKFCQTVINTKEDSLETKRKDYETKRDEFNFICDNIGEGYVKGIVKNHLTQVERILDKDRLLTSRIDRLEKEIKELKIIRDEKN